MDSDGWGRIVSISVYRSGFVYAAVHPTNPKWVKLGFTRLTPWSRLKSLSSTSVREPFTLHDARFMWDALSSEQRAHQWVERAGFPRQKEFFEIDVAEIAPLFDALEQHDHPSENKITVDQQWDQDFLDGLQNQYDDFDHHIMKAALNEWSEEDLQGRWKYTQNAGMRDLEERSAQGDPHASLLLAKKIAQEGVSLQNVRYCTTLALAAQKQGLEYAYIQALQWESLVNENVLPQYWECLWTWRERKIAGEDFPPLIDEVFEVEQHLSRHSPSRSKSWSSWCAGRPLKRSV